MSHLALVLNTISGRSLPSSQLDEKQVVAAQRELLRRGLIRVVDGRYCTTEAGETIVRLLATVSGRPEQGQRNL